MSGFAFEDHLSYSVVRFEPTLHEMSWGDVETEAAGVSEKLRDATTGNLLIDLSPMELIQSGLVASMVRMWKATEEHPKRQVVVAAPNEIVNEVLRSAGLFKVFNVVDNLEDATSKFGASKLGQQLDAVEKRVPVWGLALAMLLVGVVMGACGIMFFGAGSSDRSDAPEQSNSNNDGDAADSEAPPPDDPSGTETEEESEEADDSTSSRLEGEGKLTVRGIRKPPKDKEDTDDESVKDESEPPPDSDPEDT